MNLHLCDTCLNATDNHRRDPECHNKSKVTEWSKDYAKAGIVKCSLFVSTKQFANITKTPL
jgi:hypothetical protein